MLEHSPDRLATLLALLSHLAWAWRSSGSSPVPFIDILGLSYPSFSTPEITPIFDNLEEQGVISEPVFAFYLSM